MGKGTFVPHQLFASGAQGAWYDPSDFSTLFQNATGTTPVTAVEQPVRLMLDRSRGLVLGAELVTNGGFDSATGWTLGAGWSISGGQLLYPTGAGVTDATQNIITANRLYVMEIDVASLSGSTLIVFVGSSTFVTITTIGVHRFQLFTTGDNRLIIRPNATSTNVAINSISVRELPGNHATAPNDASRPVLRARYNLLTFSEQFDNAAWSKSGGTLSASAPWTLTEDTTNAQRAFVYASASRPTLIAGSHTAFFDVSISDAVERRVILYNNGTSGSARVLFDLETVSVIAHAATTDRAIIDLGGGIFRLIVTWDATAGTSGPSVYTAPKTETTTNPPLFVGDGAQTLTVYRASLLTAADQSATGGAYQRVGAATDYDVSNPVWRPYLAFDGSDDSFSTSSIDFSGTDEVTLFAGLTKLSDTARGMVAEFGNLLFPAQGMFALNAPRQDAQNSYSFQSYGSTGAADATATTYAAPITNVVTGIGDISGDVSTLRVNGAQAATNATDQGTGNYGNYSLFIGRRNNTSNPFNGRLTSLIVLGRTATAAEISATESWINGKTGAY